MLQLEGSPLFQELRSDFSRFVEAFNTLGKNMDGNFGAQGQALQFLDSRLVAVMMVLDDLVVGGVENVTKRLSSEEDPKVEGVAWASYVERYSQAVRESQEKKRQLEEKAVESWEGTPPAEARGGASEDDSYITTEFGGNEGASNVENGFTEEAQAAG